MNIKTSILVNKEKKQKLGIASIIKKVPLLFMSAVLLISSVIPLSAADENDYEKPQIDHTPYTYTASPDEIFSVYYSFHNYEQKYNPVSDFVFTITDTGILTLVEGGDVNNGLGYYNFKFSVPEKPTVSTTYIRYTISYKYIDGNKKEQSESKNYYTRVDIRTDEIPETGSVSLVNVKSQETGIGKEPVINAQIVNSFSYILNDAAVTVLDDKGVVIVKNYIGQISADSKAHDIAITLPAYNTAGKKPLTIKIEYTDKDNKTQSVSVKHTLNITEGEPLLLESVNYPTRITAELQSEISFKLVNKSDTEYKNAQLYFYKGEQLLYSEFIGLVAAQQQTPVKFNYTFGSNLTGTEDYQIKVTYENPVEKLLTLTSDKKLTVYGNAKPELNNITLPEKITAKTPVEIKFNIINKSEVIYTNAEACLYDGKTLLESVYIGAVQAQSQISGTITHSFKNHGKKNYTITIKYNNAAGKQESISKETQLDIKPFEEDEEGTGSLKIQTINPPLEALINSSSAFMFAITNPTSVSVKGVEVFVIDEKGNQLNSIYISEIGANSSYSNENMSFKTAASAGVHSYILKVLYTDNNDEEYSLTKSFSVNTVLEKKDETATEQPANIKIQKINNPAIIYTNVKTSILVTIVNAGKGTAYNVEIYVTNNEGEELAREYIGTIRAAEKIDTSYFIKYISTGDYDATLNVVYENYDDSVNITEKAYSQQVIDYRASVTDIAGYEYLEMGYQYNIEFSIVNNGTEKLLNTNVFLTDASGTKYAELYIGTIDPGMKKERQRFRNVIFNTPGQLDLIVLVTYENEDMQVFEFNGSVSTTVNQPWVPEMRPDMGGDMGVIETEFMPGEGIEEKSLEWWVLALIIGGGTIVVLVVVIIIVKNVHKKSKNKSEDDDIEYFLKQIASDKKKVENDSKEK